MAKQTGLGMNCYVGGTDVSGDIGSFQKISGTVAPLDFTGINVFAFERLGGKRDGAIDFTSYFNPTRAHPVFSALPTADVQVMGTVGTTVGSTCVAMVAKQLNYDGTRGTDGSYTFVVNTLANGFGLEWGVLLTPGLRTDTVATNGATLDQGNGFVTPAVPASTTPVTNTSPLPATVVISGGTMTAVIVNGVTVGTGAGTYTVPAGQTISMTYTVAPTWTWALQTLFGAQAYLQVTGFAGTDTTVHVQDSADGVTFADVTGLVFATTNAAGTTQRLATGNTATLRRYVRAVTTTVGGFTSATFAVQLTRNLIAGQTF